jgi:two-component system NtrC family response regulator
VTDKPKLLVVEDDPGLQRQLKWSYDDQEVIIAGDRDAALEALRTHHPAVVTLDLGLPPDPDGVSEGFATLEAILQARPATKVIVASGHGARESARRAIALGAFDFYHKPVDIDELGLIVRRAYHVAELEAENRRLAESAAGTDKVLGTIITGAPEMIKVARMVERVASANVSVMLLGASGTGKELLARGLHNASTRAKGPFVAINCAAIPENLLESELFGHERGAFTGAVKMQEGKIELAEGGTLFLDEVGDIPLPLQVKLLRFLQERVIERIGGRKSIPVDVRIVCATHQNLDAMIGQARFREDLYYRLNVFPIQVPPLRERTGDIEILSNHFLERFSKEHGIKSCGFSEVGMAGLLAHHWPGNVRELQNVVERAAILAEEGVPISAELMGLASPAATTTPPAVAAPQVSTTPSPASEVMPLHELEKRAIFEALERTNGNRTQAAELLQISIRTLRNKLAEYRVGSGDVT